MLILPIVNLVLNNATGIKITHTLKHLKIVKHLKHIQILIHFNDLSSPEISISLLKSPPHCTFSFTFYFHVFFFYIFQPCSTGVSGDCSVFKSNSNGMTFSFWYLFEGYWNTCKRIFMRSNIILLRRNYNKTLFNFNR